MKAKSVPVKGINKAVQLSKALAYLPGADTSLTISAKGSKLTVSADTAGIKIRSTMEAEVEEEGTVLIEMTHLSALHLKGTGLSIEADKKGNIQIRCGRSTYKLSAVEGEPHSVKVPQPTKDTLQLPISMLKKGISAIWFGHDEGGSGDLRFVFSKGKFTAETSDNYKGVVWSVPMKTWKMKKSSRIVLKEKTAEVLATSFDSEEQVWVDVVMGPNDTPESFQMYTSDSLVMVPAVVDTTLSDVSGMLKSRLSDLKMSYSFQVKSEEIADVAQSAASVVEETAKLKSVQTYIKVDDEKNTMSINTEGDIGAFSTRIKITEFKSEGKSGIRKVCVLSKHLKDLVDLATKTGKEVGIEVWGKDIVIIKNIEGDFKATHVFPQAR